MSFRKVYHVGLMKSGTTYIQEILFQNNTLLNENGWSYPGNRSNQQHACYSLCGSDIPWVRKPWSSELGAKLVKKVRKPQANTIISAEALSALSPEGIDRLLEKLGKPDRVIFTLRGLGKLLPSAWQQYLKGGGQATFMSFVQTLKEQRKDRSGFWRTYSYGDSVCRWAKYAPVDVVILPASPKTEDEFWQLFRKAAGLPDVPVPEVPPERANLSLNLETAAILRQMNCILPRNDATADAVRNTYLNRVVFPQAGQRLGNRIALPTEVHELVGRWNEEEVEKLLKFASEIHGDPKDLCLETVESSALTSRSVASVAASQFIDLLSTKAPVSSD